MYICSKLSCDNEYIVWEKTAGGVNRAAKNILIKGGANVMNRKTMETPNGVVTEISKADYNLLKNVAAFKDHVAGGYITVHETKPGAEKKADKKDEDKKDGGAQLTPEDYEKRGIKPPKTSPNA